MILRQIGRALLVVWAAGLCFGCGKSPSITDSSPVQPPPPKMETVARVHWLGRKAIASDTNAAGVMQIWNLPESARLEAQTLDKLSAAPWRFLRRETNPASTNLLHPLLQDLVDEESYVEIRHPAGASNAPGEMIMAVRLNDQRAGLWETNLAAAIASLTHMQPQPAPGRRWSLKKHHAPNLIEFARAGDWTVLGAAQDHNALLDETLARIQQDHSPFAGPATNLWLDARVDLPGAIAVIGRQFALPANFPVVSLSVLGEDKNVRTRCTLDFPNQQVLVLDPWNIPTNVIASNLTSFAAIRGFRPILSASKFWREVPAPETPDQLYVWSTRGMPAQTYFAAPLPHASNIVSRISDRLLSHTPSSSPIRFRKARTFNGLEWQGPPFLSPFLESEIIRSNDFIIGGLFPRDIAEGGPPPTLFAQLDQTNLVAYDWESTGKRIGDLIYIGQFTRMVTDRQQLSVHSSGMAWLNSAAKHLDFSATEITQSAPGRLSLNRRSSIGFTASELNLLVDWLESPDFPFGLHSSLPVPSQ